MKRRLVMLFLAGMCLVGLLGLLATHPANAEPVTYWLNLGGISAHDRGHHNGFNPGVGIEVRTSDAWAFFGGAYRNSDWRTSRYLGVNFTPWRLPLSAAKVHVGIQAGAMDGYPLRNGGAFPAAALVADVRFPRTALQLTYLPRVEAFKNANTLALAFKVRF